MKDREDFDMKIAIPPYALDVLNRLEANGFEAFVVGGCVRDSLMGAQPGDWDVCTSATPEEMRSCFSGYRVIETGLRHGTLTVRSGGENVEVTAYRLDGQYRDHRRPESVEFVRSLDMDLKRRDFTVNAMAYSPRRGLVDLFGGREDIRRRVIRCVGDPGARFGEDALRLLRALRFAARFDFAIDPETDRALRENAGLMSAIAAERIFAEWKKLVAARAARRVLAVYADVFDGWIPGLDAGRADALSYWDRLPERPALRTALLCRDARGLCAALKADTAFTVRVCRLAQSADAPPPDTPAAAMRFLAAFGPDTIWDRIDLAQARGEDADACRLALARAESEGRVWRVEDLAVTGNDLMSLGLSGPALGKARRALLDAVMDGRLPNRRAELLAEAETRAGGGEATGEATGGLSAPQTP